jgi:myosin heavy subunit
MSEPVTPKVKKRVIDAEVVSETKSGYSRQSSPGDGQTRSEGSTKQSTGFALKPRTFGQWMALILVVAWLLAVAYLIKQQEKLNWQTESINALQQRTQVVEQQVQKMVEQQKSQAKQLEAMQATLAQIQQQLNSPERQPVVSQADIEKMQAEIAQLQSQLQSVGESLAEQSKQLMAQMGQAAEKVAKNPQVQQNLNALEQQIQQLAQRFQSMMSGAKEPSTEPKTEDEPKTAPKPEMAPLSTMEISRWVVQINTQWQMSGNVEQTLAQLQALEQAVSVSQLPNKYALIKAIGQDVALLNQWRQTQMNAPEQLKTQMEALRAWIIQLPQAMQNAAAKNSESSEPSPATDATGAKSSTEQTSSSATDKLLERFSQLFSIRKKDDQQPFTQAELSALQSVIVQRGLFLVDQLEWAVETQNATELALAIERLEKFVQRYAPQARTELDEKLAPFKSLKFKVRPSLHIMEAL